MSLYSTDHLGGTILFTNGVWDMLHYGHVSFLQFCRQYCDHLIVGMNSDSSVKNLKGNKRPIIPEFERKQMLLALKCVDYVVVFDEPNASHLIHKFGPNLYAKSDEYRDKVIPEFQTCYETGTKIMLVTAEPHVRDIHTSSIIKRVLERELVL